MPNGTATYTLRFNADTSQAKQELQGLQNSINNLITLRNKTDPLKDFKSSINDAVGDVAKLSAELTAATNNNGTLNIGKLANAWKASGKTLDDYRRSLSALGPEGERAFRDLATAIANAQKPVRELDGLIGKFAKGLANTAMWTLQSNAIHAFQSALSGAFNYAQKLNKGLTDIAIVSDLTGSQLAQFAKTANQMAKDLSASTSDVVSGALIYYQAGLSDEEVIKRTETTIKLAQTSGESAEQISSYMTAIWNNFYDGSKSVEYYADAISYLGAVTAASNADIAEGMQAFSAVADTVGLSFEYGASALTLLRDVTQQSASTIGNSLKTIFARLSSLKMGETLEDGVDLTKYTKALETVGVQVLDANGELKDMDVILDDLSNKWDNLTKAQKDALAQTVGGVRQYNNLISLMDNYERFEELVAGARGSEGYLQHQADIYAESWEAAKNRVQAAWQDIFNTIIDDKFLIQLTDIFSGILNIIGSILKNSGGLTTILPLIIGFLSIGINDNLAKINARFKEIVQNTLQFKNTLKDAKDLQDQARQAALQISFIPTSDKDAGSLDILESKYSSILSKIQEMRALGAGEDQIQAATLEAERYYHILSSIAEKMQQLENTNNLAYSGVFLPSSGNNSADDIVSKVRTQAIRNATFNNFKSYQNNKAWEADGGAEAMRTWATQYLTALPTDDDGNVIDVTLGNLLKRISSYENTSNKNGGVSSADFNQYAKDFGEIIDNNLYKTFLDPKEPNSLINTIYKEAKVDDASLKGKSAKEKLDAGEIRQRIGEEIKAAVETGKTEGELWGHNLELNNQVDETLTKYDKFNAKLKETNASLGANAGYILSVVNGLTSFVSALNSVQEGLKKLASNEIGDGLKQIGSGLLSLGAASVMILHAVENSTLLSGAVTSLGATVSAAFGKAATGSAALAIGLGAVTAAVVGLYIVVKLGIHFWKKYQESLPENKLKKTNEELEKQKNYVAQLANEYDGLTSTLKSLTDEYDELNKKQQGTLDYLMALEAWNSKLAELEKKYGITFETDENGAKILDQNKLTEAISGRLSRAQAERQALEIKSARQAREVAEDQIFGSADNIKKGLKKYENASSGIEEYKINGKSIAADEFDKYVNRFMTLAKEDLSGDNAEAKIRAALEGADENIIQFFLLKLQNLNEAIQAEQKADNFSSLVSDTLRGKNIYAAAAESGHNSEEVNAAINAYAKAQAEIYRKESNATNNADAIAAYEQDHNVKYSDGKFYELTESGEIDKNKALNIEVGDVVAGYIKSRIDQDLENLDANEIADIINKYSVNEKQLIDKDQISKLAQQDADRKQLAIDTANAEKLGFDKAEYQEYVAYLQEVDEELAKNQQLADQVALANMRINRGVETLNDNFDKWKETIENANASGNEWTKRNLDYKEAITGIKDALADIANINIDDLNLDEKFITDNLSTIEKAAEGNADAIDDLIKLIAIDFTKALSGNKKEIDGWEQSLVDAINKVNFNEIKINAHLNDEMTAPLHEALMRMVEGSEDAAEWINNYLATIGYTPIVEDMIIPSGHYDQVQAEASGEIVYKDDEGKEHRLAVEQSQVKNYIQEDGSIKIPIIKGSNGGKGTPQYASKQNIAKALGSSVFTGGTGRNVSGSNRHGSSGGSGGSGHHRTPKAKDEDRYHEINQKLKQTEHELNKVNTLKDRSYGRGRLNAMDEEIKLLEREAEQYKELYREAEHWFALDKSALVNFGASFNPDGTIANYQAWQESWIDRYNNESISEEEFSAWQKAVQKYEDSLAHLNEAEEKYIQKMNQIYDEHLEKVVYRVEYLNELIELSTDYLDYLIEKLDEDMYDTAETVAKMGEKASNILEQVNNIQQGIFDALTDKNNHPKLNAHQEIISEYLKGERDLQDVLNNIGQLTDKEQEQLREWMGQLIDYNKELRKTQKEAYDKIIESIEEFNDKMERQQDIVNDTAGVMEHYANIIDIIGKDTLGISDAMMNALNDLQVTAAQSNLTIALTALNENRDALAKIQKDLAEARKQQAETDDELRKRALENDIKYLEEAMEQQEDIVRELAEEWASAYEDALKSAQDAFTNGVKLATEAFDKAVSGSIGSLDKLQDFYDKQTTLQDIFLPDYERIHDLSKLARDINNAINATDNIKGKERLRNLQNEILEAQREGTELSKYDMEFMQKRFELEQAQIAMEEQRNAKNLVRMTRDNEGNWSYTYTQNPENVAKAQQEFEDKLYDLEKLNQDRVKETQQLMLNAMEKFRDEIADADMNDQEKTQALLDYWRQLQEEYGNLTDTALKDGKWITDTYDVSNHELTDSFEETLLSLGTGYQTLEDFMNDFRSASATMGDDVAAQYQKWGDYVKAITEAAGINFDNFAQRVADDMDLVIAAMIGEDGNGGAVGVAKQLADEMGISVDDILKELEGWWNGPEGRSILMEAEIEENEKTYEQLERLIANADQIPVELPKISQAIQKIASGGGNECGCGATCTTTCWTDCGSNCANYTRTTGGVWYYTERGEIKSANTKEAAERASDHYYTVSQDKKGIKRLATGGYTGEWGSQGRLAILDEKELVLNKEDTANMLATVGFVRDLVEMIGVNATSAGGIGNLLLSGVASGGNYLDQNVNIHAEFPNATNHNEIEEAFQNLIGLAGQYAGRKQ